MSKGKAKPIQESFFHKFVENENDVVGLLSYALYQKAWQHHKENLRKEKYADGIIPHSEASAYQSMFEGQILAHRAIAVQMLNKRYEEFASKVYERIHVLEVNVQTICSNSHHIPSIVEKVHKRIGFFGFSFWQNVVASAAFPVLLGVIILLYNLGSDTDLWPLDSHSSQSDTGMDQVKPDSLQSGNQSR